MPKSLPSPPVEPQVASPIPYTRLLTLIRERDPASGLPVWIRVPSGGPEPYTGLTRGFIYSLADKGLIRSASLREPGKRWGCRLFSLRDILEFIEQHATERKIA